MPRGPRTLTCGYGVKSYWSGCRCDECREASNEYRRGWTKRRAEKLGLNRSRSTEEIIARNEKGEKQYVSRAR